MEELKKFKVKVNVLKRCIKEYDMYQDEVTYDFFHFKVATNSAKVDEVGKEHDK